MHNSFFVLIFLRIKYEIMLKKTILLLIACFALTTLQAQHVVRGVVSSPWGETMPGVSITVKGTSSGTTTQLDGSYTLTTSEDAILVFSFVGYQKQEIAVNGISVINVLLQPGFHDLNEVVVVGYGVQQKKLLTGATVQVSGDDLTRRNSTNLLQALQGQTAGVQISSRSGQPGEGLRVVVRGLGTIGNAGPLYIVDGVQTGDISYLNNSDIERVDILKDAASAAIYGSQAANGVVLITTRSGTRGKSQLTFDSYYGLQSAARRMEMLNAREYAVLMNEASINVGRTPQFTAAEIAAMPDGTNWMDEMFYDNAITQNYTLGASGGTDVSLYSLSLSYTDQAGIVGGPDVSKYDRFNFRINTDHKLLGDVLSVGQNLTYGYMRKNGISVGNQYNNTLRGAFNTSPFLPMYDDDGNFLNNSSDRGVMYNNQPWTPWQPSESNPYAAMILNNQSRNNNQKLFGNVYMDVNPFKGLRFRSTFGLDYYVDEGQSYLPEYELSMYAQRPYDRASQNFSKGTALSWDNVLTYDFSFNNHSFTTMAGMFAYQNKGSWLNVGNTHLIISDLTHAYITNTTNTDFTLLSFGGGPFDESKLLSYFGRIIYDYNQRYLLNATFRADGSSRFAKGNRWGYFPSVSAGWIVTEEDFMAGARDYMDFFKLRASWGQVGNQSISAFQYLAPITTQNTGYYFGSEDFDASGNVTGAYPSRLSNENVKWETSEQINIGFDSYFLMGRLGVNFDWYNKTTKDWLITAPILATAGANPPSINGGNVSNKGVELATSWNDKVGEFNYFISGNVSYNKNNVTNVPTTDSIVHGLTNMLYDNAPEFYHRARTGFPIGYFYGYQTDGIFQNEAEVYNYRNAAGIIVQPNAKPGDVRYVDQNGDGVINEGDKVKIGDPNPDYIVGFSFGFNWKKIDFSMAGHGLIGFDVFQSYRNHTNGFANYSREFLNRWHGEGTSNTIPRVTETNINYHPSDIFVKNADFLRISDITLGYDLSGFIPQGYVNQFRIYASVQNAFTFTKYNGMDPEIGYGLENGSAGVDVGYYPRPRTVLVGLNVKF